MSDYRTNLVDHLVDEIGSRVAAECKLAYFIEDLQRQILDMTVSDGDLCTLDSCALLSWVLDRKKQ
jgi:hypothetical protein